MLNINHLNINSYIFSMPFWYLPVEIKSVIFEIFISFLLAYSFITSNDFTLPTCILSVPVIISTICYSMTYW